MNTKKFLFTIITFLSAQTLLPARVPTRLSTPNTHTFSAEEQQQINSATINGAIAGAQDAVKMAIPGLLIGIPIVVAINEITTKKINRLELAQWLLMMSTGIISLCGAGGAITRAINTNIIATKTILNRHGKPMKKDKVFS